MPASKSVTELTQVAARAIADGADVAAVAAVQVGRGDAAAGEQRFAQFGPFGEQLENLCNHMQGGQVGMQHRRRPRGSGR